jgi:hypothetical protein
MNNENDLLEFANDMKEQYNDMKQQYEKKIAFLNQEILSLQKELKLKPELIFLNEQFHSTRPFATKPIYTYIKSTQTIEIN